MRRDIEKHVTHTYSVVILDEAQQIKNRAMQFAAKQLQTYRLVLSGTPIENSVSDLWSIMDFLMPSYLGSHKDFTSSMNCRFYTGVLKGISPKQVA